MADLVVGVPSEDIAGKRVGAINVIYGSAAGLTANGNQFFHEDVPGIEGTAEAADRFGAALAAGDFNGDGRSDLAIGSPGEDVGNVQDAGAVHVLYGSSGGLTPTGDQLFDQNSSGIVGVPQDRDFFGQSLAWADFAKETQGDLAIGSPGDNEGGAVDSGVVHVLYGTSAGLTTLDNTFVPQGGGTADEVGEQGDFSGFALSAGDYGLGARADLAVGIPFEDRGGTANVGAVRVIFGAEARLQTGVDQFFTQGGGEGDDRFGHVLATGDFDADGAKDLAITAPGEDTGGDDDAGQVSIKFGSARIGITSGSQEINQDTQGIPGETEGSDNFGLSLAAGNFGKGAATDLAIGVPLEDINTDLGFLENRDIGSVAVVFGGGGGLSGEGATSFDNGDVPETSAGRFGLALSAWNYGRGAESDLAVGTPSQNDDSGIVNVVYGSATGPNLGASQAWTQNTPGIIDAAEDGDRFGSALY